jgi:hypothetical protein
MYNREARHAVLSHIEKVLNDTRIALMDLLKEAPGQDPPLPF